MIGVKRITSRGRCNGVSAAAAKVISSGDLSTEAVVVGKATDVVADPADAAVADTGIEEPAIAPKAVTDEQPALVDIAAGAVDARAQNVVAGHEGRFGRDIVLIEPL